MPSAAGLAAFETVRRVFQHPRCQPLMLLLALPMAWVLLRLDREADRPDRLRGLSHDPAPAFPPTVGVGSEVV